MDARAEGFGGEDDVRGPALRPKFTFERLEEGRPGARPPVDFLGEEMMGDAALVPSGRSTIEP